MEGDLVIGSNLLGRINVVGTHQLVLSGVSCVTYPTCSTISAQSSFPLILCRMVIQPRMPLAEAK